MWVFRLVLKDVKESDCLIFKGSEFHSLGAALTNGCLHMSFCEIFELVEGVGWSNVNSSHFDGNEGDQLGIVEPAY